MDRVLAPPARWAPAPTGAALRTREPRGILRAPEASARMAALVGRPIRSADTSLGRLVLTIAAAPAHLVVLSAPVRVTGPQGGGASLVEPGSAAARQLFAPWVGRCLTDLHVGIGGGLRLGCGESSAQVDADPVHEAWEVRGMDGGLLACLPGGAISLWTPTFGRVPVRS